MVSISLPFILLSLTMIVMVAHQQQELNQHMFLVVEIIQVVSWVIGTHVSLDLETVIPQSM